MAGDAQHFVDRPAALAGRDGVEVGYFTFSWTPLRDETGGLHRCQVQAPFEQLD